MRKTLLITVLALAACGGGDGGTSSDRLDPGREAIAVSGNSFAITLALMLLSLLGLLRPASIGRSPPRAASRALTSPG